MAKVQRTLRSGCLTLTLNRPEQRNALDSDVIAELGAALSQAISAPDVGVIVVTGVGAAFCAGADLHQAARLSDDPIAFREWLYRWHRTFRSLEEIPKPTIAAVNGWALAGGLELALSCDIIVAKRSARLGDVHASYGLVPGGGGSQRLPDAVGRRTARWLMFSGEVITADRAYTIGLVQQVFADDEYDERLRELTEKLATSSGTSLAFMKEMSAPRDPWNEALLREIDLGVDVLTGDDAKEGLRAFLDKRKPAFRSAANLRAEKGRNE